MIRIRSGRSALLGAAAVAVAVAVGAGVMAATADGAAPAATEPTSVSAAPTASANPFAAGGLQDPNDPDADVAYGDPVSVTIPSIGISSTLEDLAVGAAGELQAPVDYDLAGWYADGVAPGEVGPAIIAGHVDSPTGPAVFQNIGALTPGDHIEVETTSGETLTFTVTGSAQSGKSEFPTSDVYSNVPTPDLRLITCAGPFDRSSGHYTDNLIVYATLTP